MRTVVFCILFCLVQVLVAQEVMTWEDFVEHYKADEADEGGNDDELFERLYEIHASKINLNQATEEQLSELPFLTQPQIEALLRFISYNAPLSSMGELMAVPQLDYLTRQYLMLFAYAGSMPEDKSASLTPAALLRNIDHELMVRGDIPFYRQAGYVPKKAEGEPAFAGDRYASTLRYNLQSMKHLYVGLSAQKDAGERWWSRGDKGNRIGGPDYLGGYFMLKDISLGRGLNLKSVILGNYKLSLGLGLTMNTSFSLGKLMSLSDNLRMDKGVSRHSSSAEYGYLTGGATTISIGNIGLTAFCSRRSHDATPRNDADAVTTLNTSGYHRTISELNRRGSVALNDWGANLHWDVGGNFSLGASAVITRSSVPLAPKHNTEASMYRYYNAQGSSFGVYGVSYGYRDSRLKIAGETAVSHGNTLLSDNMTPLSRPTAFATLNMIRWQANTTNALMLVGRVYQARFVSINGSAFGENSKPQNESGVFLGWTSTSISDLKIEAYADLMYFPWLKYRVRGSSYGYEGMLQLTYTPGSKLSLSARYRIKSKQKDSDEEQQAVGYGQLVYGTTHTARIVCDWAVLSSNSSSKPSPSLSLRTSANLTSCQAPVRSARYGFAFSETARLKLLAGRLQLDAGAVLFRTDDYDSRIYAYEPSLLYSFGMASYYYHGYKLLMVLKGEVARRLWLTARFAHTRYTNRTVISSGNTEIPANHREDLQLQLRYVF